MPETDRVVSVLRGRGGGGVRSRGAVTRLHVAIDFATSEVGVMVASAGGKVVSDGNPITPTIAQHLQPGPAP